MAYIIPSYAIFWKSYYTVYFVLWIYICCTSPAQSQNECRDDGHRVLKNSLRSIDSTASALSGILCDKTLERGWYRFEIFGKNAEMPTECVQVRHCGTDAPMWLNTKGKSLPAVGLSARHTVCVAWTLGQRRTSQDCCLFSFNVRVTNCGDYFTYYLPPARGCNMAYCATEARAKCSANQTSPDGFAPCRENFPAIIGLPEVSPVLVRESVELMCSFNGLDDVPGTTKGYTVTWYKKTSIDERYQKVASTDTYENFVSIDLRENFRMGHQVICSVQAFFNETRSMKSPPIESDPFDVTVKIQPAVVDIAEGGRPQRITFESTVPITCRPGDLSCAVRIPLTAVSDDFYLGPDISLSECFVDFRPRFCSEVSCRQASILVTAVTDFQRDGQRNSVIVTHGITSNDPFWDGYDPGDIQVTVTDVPTAQCYSFTEPHFITLDRRKFDFYKTGTFVLYKSLIREFEVHNRIWDCGGSMERVSCNCGFVVREDNDVIAVDMCERNNELEAEAQIRIKSPPPVSSGVRIKQARNGTKVTVELASGAFVRADISHWGMSITIQAPSIDFNNTAGLCGTFDGNPDNDFHDQRQLNLGLALKHGQANEFVEMWRLRDGGLFNNVPRPAPFQLRFPSCSCALTSDLSWNLNVLLPGLNVGCDDDFGGCVTSRCSRFDDVSRYQILHSSDVTTMYTNAVNTVDTLINNPLGGHEVIYEDYDITDPFLVDNYDERTRRYNEWDNFDQPFSSDFYSFTPGPPGGVTNGELRESYFFYPDHNTINDLRPLHLEWPTPTGITETHARDMCEDQLRNSTLGEVCGRTLLGTDMYVDDAIEVCIKDVQLTDDLSWIKQSTPLLENLCEAAIVDNRTSWTLKENLHVPEIEPPFQIVQALNCPHDCSGNGECLAEGCSCNPGFTAADCSITEGSIPELIRLQNNGICDRRTQACESLRVEAAVFEPNKQLICFFSMNQHTNDRGVMTIDYKQTTGTYINKRTVLCPAPPLEEAMALRLRGGRRTALEPIRWEVKVSYSDSSPSKGLPFIIYDTKCQHCNWLAACTLKPDTCLVKGECYTEGEHNPTTHCQQCLPRQSLKAWSLAADNQPPTANTSPRLRTFVGGEIRHVIDADDTDGDIDHFTLTPELVELGVRVFAGGVFTWSPESHGHFSVDVIMNDDCGATAPYRLEITVVPCKCQHGGYCIPNPNDLDLDPTSHVCECVDEFTGVLCEKNLDPCFSSPCVHGECNRNEGDEFDCECPEGYSGNLCATSNDPCDRSPCYPGVHCRTHGPTSFTCGMCPAGFTGNGITCELIGSLCKEPCPRNMECNPRVGCVCRSGYWGRSCYQPHCYPPCENNGRCIGPNYCRCPAGFSGPNCQIAQCDPPCVNGAQCVGRNVCRCNTGYVGAQCQTMTCQLHCQNGGYCLTPDTCKCQSGYTGTTCAISQCQPHCRNGGVCIRPGVCLCPRGTRGALCEIGMCSVPCQNGGRCVRPNMCRCPKGYTGSRCELPSCEPRCQNGGRCVTPNKCSCPSGYRGRKCHKAICVSGCRNGGECIKPNVCMCKTGYGGSSCHTPVCNRSCMYGGRCTGPDQCTCPTGYSGRYCETRPSSSYSPRRYIRDRSNHVL